MTDIPGALKPVTDAVGVSFQVEVGDGMGIVFQTHIPADQAANGQLHGLLDHFYEAGRRQRAKGEIKALRKHIEGQRKQIEAGDARVEQAEHAHKQKIEQLQKLILEEQKKREAVDTQGRQQHEDRGRGGKYSPSTQTNQKLASHDAQIAKHRAEMIALNTARDQALAAEAHARSVAEAEIEATEEQIREREALVNPPD